MSNVQQTYDLDSCLQALVLPTLSEIWIEKGLRPQANYRNSEGFDEQTEECWNLDSDYGRFSLTDEFRWEDVCVGRLCQRIS